MGKLESENPYCMICSRHLGMPFHETNEHSDAVDLIDGRVDD
jgi:hypothetical protein